MSYQYVKDSRKRRKEDIVYVMGGCCQICGYNRAITALDLHHLNPEDKEFGIGAILNKDWELMNSEIQKCILVCANCHREIHEGLITKDLKSSYDINKANEISERINRLKHHQDRYCSKCGEIISQKAEYCPKCANEIRQKVERPSREELKQLIRKESFLGIARMYDNKITDNAIRKWCDAYKLPRTKKEINSYSDEEWEQI
jgi:hypothetical protein